MTDYEDEETQINGNVLVYYGMDMDKPGLNLLEMAKKGVGMLVDLPIRNMGVHFCFNNPRSRAEISLLQLVIGTQNRLRFRQHFGMWQDHSEETIYVVPLADTHT